MKVTQVYPTHDLRHAAKLAAREDSVSMAEVIRQALTVFLAQRQSQQGQVQ